MEMKKSWPWSWTDGDTTNKDNLMENRKNVTWRDEQIQGMSLEDASLECQDPFLEDMLEIPFQEKFRYSRETLFKLREAPLSQKRPDFIDTLEVVPSIFDTERWGFDRKKSETSIENGPRAAADVEHRRRPGDPRERLRKENDGIVLSPQRRSFTTGCCVPGREIRSNRPHSPLGGAGGGGTGGKKENSHASVREIPQGARRIGSGRILRDSWDFNDKSDHQGDNDSYPYVPPSRGGPSNQQQRNDDKYERRSFGRDFDMNKEPTVASSSSSSSRRNGRFNDRRRMDREIEEPEWFSSGPVSQHDTIELRGFDEPEKAGKKKMSPSRVKRYKEWVKKKSNEQPLAEEKDEKAEATGTTTAQQQGKSEEGTKEASAGEAKGNQSFNFDDIFNNESWSKLLVDGDTAAGDKAAGKSRFSRWFTHDSPEKRRNTDEDNNDYIKSMLNDITNEPSLAIPAADSELYFSPISPAANTSGVIGDNKFGGGGDGKSVNIMEMLQHGKHKGREHDGGKSLAGVGKIMNLDEIEAKMRQSVDMGTPQHKPQPKPDEEMAAFKKLMLNHSQQQDEARAQILRNDGTEMRGPNLDWFLLQPKIHDLIHQSRELLNRPEAQAILQALHQRIPSPRELQVHTQNILQRALIKKKLEEQQENFRKKQELQRGQSPNPNMSNGNQPVANKSVSSPSQLMFTPTSVLRKMTADKDEGKENKMDGKLPQGRALTGMKPQVQQQQPQWAQQFSLKQPVGRPIVKANTNANYPSQQSQTDQFIFQQQQRMYNQAQAQQQQRKNSQNAPVYHHQANVNGAAASGVPPPSHHSHPQFPNNQQFAQQQLTQQQLRAQHQQHARPIGQQPAQQQQGQAHHHHQLPQLGGYQANPQMGAWQQFLNSTPQNNRMGGNPVVGRGGGLTDGDLSPTTSNQLARWFSPDLLERARGGELPSTAGLGQNALSLEEIERQTAPAVHN